MRKHVLALGLECEAAQWPTDRLVSAAKCRTALNGRRGSETEICLISWTVFPLGWVWEGLGLWTFDRDGAILPTVVGQKYENHEQNNRLSERFK